jgi:hypothetical protein
MNHLHFFVSEAPTVASFLSKGRRWIMACLFALQMIGCTKTEPVSTQESNPEPTYYPADVALINRLIDENDFSCNGIKYTKADPADGTYIPEDWSNSIIQWSDSATGKRIIYIISQSDSYSLNGDVDLSGLDSLRQIEFLGGKAAKVKATNMKALKKFTWRNEMVMDSLDLSGTDSLDYLWLSSPGLSGLDLSGKDHLKTLYVTCNLTDLDVSRCKELETLVCHGNQLTRLNLLEIKNLKSYHFGFQSLSLTLTGSGSRYTVDVAMDAPTFAGANGRMSYSNGQLICTDTTLKTVDFYGYTGYRTIPPNVGLFGSLYLSYKEENP